MSRFDFDTLTAGEFWGDTVAEELIAAHPNEATFTCAAGISPSGIVHFGNFRDIITSYVVANALKRRGKQVRLIFSWDNFDRLRKVPAGVDPSFAEHIGKPLSKVPDPEGEFSSYAERFQAPFVDAMKELGIELTYIDQTKQYEAGVYDAAIQVALDKRADIARILLSFMTDKAKEAEGLDEEKYVAEFYPISVYSRFTGKDNTKVRSRDGTKITYWCADTNQEETVDLAVDRIAKLGWKTDWAMRWKHEGVRFEPGGHDHASPGGSYDAATRIAKEIFQYDAPVFAEYKFVGIQGLGAKMSGSKGNAISPKDLLEIYDPIVLKWMYLRKSPQQSFMLAFDSELYRQYDEFDREAAAYFAKTAEHVPNVIMQDSIGTLADESIKNPIPYRQAVAFGQIAQWNAAKLTELLTASGFSYDSASITTRLPRAEQWLTKYNPEEKIELRSEPNTTYASTLDDSAKTMIRTLREELAAKNDQTVSELDELVYRIPKHPDLDEKALKTAQRAFFKHVYNLLIGKDTGPRLSTFLWSIDRARALSLLAVS